MGKSQGIGWRRATRLASWGDAGKLFEGVHFDREGTVLCARWYLRDGLGLRERAGGMVKGGLPSVHSDQALRSGGRPVVERRRALCKDQWQVNLSILGGGSDGPSGGLHAQHETQRERGSDPFQEGDQVSGPRSRHNHARRLPWNVLTGSLHRRRPLRRRARRGEFAHIPVQRSRLKQARNSATKMSGCSKAAKCPPFATSFQ